MAIIQFYISILIIYLTIYLFLDCIATELLFNNKIQLSLSLEEHRYYISIFIFTFKKVE